MPEAQTFDYAVVRVVPRVERHEFVNAGVIVFSRPLEFLGALIELDRRRLAALDPDTDPEAVERQLATIPRVCAGGRAAGALGRLTISERFHWLTQPSSGLVQTSPVHSGLASDPRAVLHHLLNTMVRRRPPAPGPAPDASGAPGVT